MRTQLDDLNRKLKDAELNKTYLESRGLNGTDIHKYVIGKIEDIKSYISNIN